MNTTNGAGRAPLEAPNSVQEVEELVKRLYLPGTPKVITQIDTQLKQLQLSAEGWQLADALVGSTDQNVRFFGALTFQVKLNNEGFKLDEAAASAVLTRLISWAVKLDGAGEGHLVRKKLCAALGTYWLRCIVPWNRPLLHLAASFQNGDAVPEDQLPAAHDALSRFLPPLSESQLVMLLWLSGTLATETTKADSTTASFAEMHTQMEALVDDASRLMHHTLQLNITHSSKLKAETLSCFLNWVNYAQPMWNGNQSALDRLRGLLQDLCTLLTDATLQADAIDVFRDILESYTTFFQAPHMDLLARIIYQHVRPRMLQGLQDNEPEVIPVAQLVIAYGVANVEQVAEQPENQYGSQNIIELLLAILQAPGYPGDDDEVSIHSIEFWNTYIEYINERAYEQTSASRWVEAAKQICMQLSMLLWSKMRTPSASRAQEWTDAESEAFREFRMDASDLMLSVYVYLGQDMLQQFLTLATNSLAEKNWQDLEAALFCVNTLADNVLEDQNAESLLVQIFSSSLFREIADFSQHIPTQARRTAIDMLGTYGQYIEHHAEFLPDTLRFLFASLETPGLYLSSAKSIASLCATCRNSLTGELDGFVAQYNQFAQSETSEPYTNEKVIGAIAAIIQAVAPESAKAQPLSALLDIVDGMVANAKQLVQRHDLEAAVTFGVSALECLASIGKGLQVPEEVPIDLYADDEKPKDQYNFWQSQEGQAIQQRILGICYSVLQILPGSGEAVDGVCSVFKAGFTETVPGPFMFPPDSTVALLEQCSISTPHLESVLAMISTLILQYSRKSGMRIDAEVKRIYDKTLTFIQELREPSNDPGIAQCCIDIFSRMINGYMNVLLDTASSGAMVQQLLDFATKAIDGADLMPKRSAADFWSKMIKPPNEPADQTIRTRLQQVNAAYGPQLCQALISQMTGKGQRSELDQLCEPLKGMIQQNATQTKAWLEAALNGGNLSAAVNMMVGDEEKRRFVQQLIGLRGSAKTRDVVKNFYAACRGTVPSYS